MSFFQSTPKGRSTVVKSFLSFPWIASKTMAQSSAFLPKGPTLSIDQLKLITPWRLTLPYVGRRPVTPFRVLGEVMDPKVSVPRAKGTSPAEVAEPEPAEEPLAPWVVSHGFLVLPPNHTSPLAKAPDTSLATNTAPASSNFLMTVAVSSISWSLYGAAPQVVG